MKKRYEKPVILQCKTGLMNKFGSSPQYSRKVRREIDGVSIDELVEKFGSPLFVFSEKKMRKRFRNLHRAFSTRYPNVTFAWSYKTNYLPAICSVFHQEGAIAEVVSEMEYEKARDLGIPGDKIIFNGPHKPMNILERAAREGAMIHIDNMDEIYDLENIAEKLNKKIKVAVRLNMDTGIHPQWSRFGFNLDSGQAMVAFRRIYHGEKLMVNGLHCHIGTFILDPKAYSIEVEKMVKLAYRLEDELGFRIDYLDIGGGFPSKNKLKGTYMSPDVAIPSMDEYAEKITHALYRNLRPGDFPRLVLETGRAMVDESGYLISQILSSKRLPDGRKAYVADAGVNIMFTSFWYKFNLETDRDINGVNEPSIIYGPLCMNIDVIDEGTVLPPLNRGTRLIISPVGAYNVTQWMQFITYRPNVVMISKNGEVDIIREGEDLSDIKRRERIPKRLLLKEENSVVIPLSA